MLLPGRRAARAARAAGRRRGRRLLPQRLALGDCGADSPGARATMRVTTRARGTSGREPICRSRTPKARTRVIRVKAGAAVLVLARRAGGRRSCGRPDADARPRRPRSSRRCGASRATSRSRRSSSRRRTRASRSMNWGFANNGFSALHAACSDSAKRHLEDALDARRRGACRRRLRLRARAVARDLFNVSLPAAPRRCTPALRRTVERKRDPRRLPLEQPHPVREELRRALTHVCVSTREPELGRRGRELRVGQRPSTSSSGTAQGLAAACSSRCSSRRRCRPPRSCSRSPPASATTRPTTTLRVAVLAASGGALLAAFASLGSPAGARGSCAPPHASAAYAARVASALASRARPLGRRAAEVAGRARRLPARAGTWRRCSTRGRPRPAAADPERRLLPAVRAARRPPRRRAPWRSTSPTAARSSRSGSAGRRSRCPSAAGRYGACLARLDAGEARRRLAADPARPATPGTAQESFAARIPETGSLVSFVRVTGPGEIRLTPTVHGLRRSGNRLVRGSRTYLVFGAGARWTGSSLVFRRAPRTRPGSRPPPHPARWHARRAAATSRRARRSARYWRARLAEGASLDVPERASWTRSGRCSSRTSSSRGATASATPTRRRRSRRASTRRR